MRIPTPLLRCPVFLGINASSGPVYAGTGFLASIEVDGEHFAYLVTARHVVEDINVYTTKNPGTSFVRLNDLNGAAFQVPLKDSTWVVSSDSMVDLAVLPIETPNQGLCLVPTSAFVYPALFDGEFGIGPGDDVFSIGLLSFVVNGKANNPVVRYGTLAMVPDGPLETALGNRDAYLIEARSLGGLSGSPVFVRETLWLSPESSYREDGIPASTPPMLAVGRTFLLGVMRGHWDIAPETIGAINVEGRSMRAGGVNIGIAMVTPASKLLELLDQSSLRSERAEALELRCRRPSNATKA